MRCKNLILLCSIIALVFVWGQSVFSQETDDSDETEINKYEVGGQFTVLRQRSFQKDALVFDVRFNNGFRYTPLADSHQTELGLGGRFTYNFNRNIAVEVEANYFPKDRLSRLESAALQGSNESVRTFVEPKGRKFQAVVGPKIGYRWKKFGVFGKVRPGVFYVNRYPQILDIRFSPPASISSNDIKAVFFSTDVGGVVELYPSKRTVLRFDIGDTIIVYKAKGIEPKEFNPGFTRHTFQFSTGFGFRF